MGIFINYVVKHNNLLKKDAFFIRFVTYGLLSPTLQSSCIYI